MNDKEKITTAIVDSIGKQYPFNKDLQTEILNSGELLVFSEHYEVTYIIQIRFQLTDIGIAPRGIEYWLRIKSIERLVETIAKENGLKYNSDFQHTIVNPLQNKELYKKITSGTLEVSLFQNLFEDFLSGEVIPFFKSRNTVKGLGEYILSHDFKNLINMGIGGEYPVNILKAISIAKLCNNEARYQEYTIGLQNWIDEDRKDPNYAKNCDSYQGALNDLKKKLEGFK